MATGPVGSRGEDAAADAYRRRGYRVVARNWRCRLGELDLVVERCGVLVFCEVKARRGSAYGGGWEAVTWRKQAKLRALAELFLQASGSRPSSVRFDVASVAVRGPTSAAVEVFEDAF
ncbi:MAG TPA: YraN family protein [Actinomycetota bacterium]|nr:YraN family protein [Actinomycetota bacterium]